LFIFVAPAERVPRGLSRDRRPEAQTAIARGLAIRQVVKQPKHMRPKLKTVSVHVLCLVCSVSFVRPIPAQTVAGAPTAPLPDRARQGREYLWYEAENMRGLSVDERHEPRLNPSWMNRTAREAPGWGINGPGVSAEWTQGGESEWNSVAASADETRAALYQDLNIPRDGAYRIWVRYADWADREETFVVRLMRDGAELFRREFGRRDLIDSRDEVSLYWGWAFAWDGSDPVELKKGAARLSLEIQGAAGARRHVDCLLVTNDLDYRPEGRRKPPFAAEAYLRAWAATKPALAPLADFEVSAASPLPPAWRRPSFAGRDFMMPWNISENFWDLYDKPLAERPLYPFHAEQPELFIAAYKGARDVPLFSSRFVVPVVYINHLAKHLKEGSAFLRYLRETRSPFAVLINYGAASFNEEEGRAAWALLNGELKGQFLGWVSGESIGHVYARAAQLMQLSPGMSRRELLEAHRAAYTRALEEKWSGTFHTPVGPMWEKLIPAQATSSTTFAHALGRWGVRSIGIETAAVQPVTALRLAFTRGAARQYGASVFYYHAPNFGDTATTFTNQQNFAGPAHFFHSRYGASMGPSLSWYRKNYFLYYMGGVSAIYLEQGFDQFFKPGPGEHPYQLNPLGRITDEFMRFAERHADRGEPYTPIAFLLDPAHGWEMTDYPHLPFGVSPLTRHDRALRELFLAAYHPAATVEGEPATADRQAFVNATFGDIFDVLVADEAGAQALGSYRALVVGGRINWTPPFVERLKKYVNDGGTIVVNSAQAAGLPADLLGIRTLGTEAETNEAECLAPGEERTDLSGQTFRYQRVEPRRAEVLLRTGSGDPLVTVKRMGRGRVVYCAVPDLLGLDERLVPAAAHALAHLFSNASPVEVTGEVEFMVNRNGRGWVVTLINNRGVYKPQQGLAQVNREEYAYVTLSLRSGSLAEASEWTTRSALNSSRQSGRDLITLRVPAGGIRIVELAERR
jgi:hypothetical protein